MSDLAEQLKDIAHDRDLVALRATRKTGRDTWTHVEVRHAGLWDDAPDGWTVTVEETSL